MSKRVSNSKGCPSKNKSKRRSYRAEPIPGRREELDARESSAMTLLLGLLAGGRRGRVRVQP